MRKSLSSILVAFLLLSLTVINAQESISADSSKIIFFRPYSYVGSANLFKVKLADNTTVRLVNESYYELTVPAGVFEFATFKSKSMGTLNVEANRTYYIRASYLPGFWSVIPELLMVDSNMARDWVKTKKLKNMRKPLLRPLNRIGVVLNTGFGFNDIDLIQTTQGDNSAMRFAGGAGVSIEAGREVEKYLDVAVSYSYMNRGLIPAIKNGSVDFSRHILSFTPSFIIPIQGGYAQRIKLGAGLDYYFNNTLNIRTRTIPGGIDDTWRYKETIGFHAQVMYEAHFSERFSFTTALRYYNVSHSFQSGIFSQPIVNSLSNPKGDGIDLRLGFYYHF